MRIQLLAAFVLLLLPIAALQPTGVSAQAPLAWFYDAGEELCGVDISGDGAIIAYATQGTQGKAGILNASGSQLWEIAAIPVTTKGVSLSPDGSYILVVNEHSITLYNVTTGAQLWTHSYAPNAPSDMSVSIEGMISAVVESFRLHIYSRTGLEIGSLNGLNDLACVDVSVNGATIAVGGGIFDNRVYMCRPDGTLLWPPYHVGENLEIRDVDLDPTGTYLAAATAESVYFFNSSGFQWSTIELDAYSVAVSLHGACIAIGAVSGVYLYNRAGNQIAAWTNPPNGDVLSVAISEDGMWIAAGSQDGCVYMFNRVTGLAWSYNTGAPVTQVVMSRDGSCVAAIAGSKLYYFTSAQPPIEVDLSAYPAPLVEEGLLNVTFIVGDSTPHGPLNLGAWTADVGGAIIVASRLGLDAEAGDATWGLDTWYATYNPEQGVIVDWSSLPARNIFYAGGPGVNLFAWMFERFAGCPFYAVLVDGVPYIYSNLSGEYYGAGDGYDYALIALHSYEGRWHLLAWGITANGTAAACQLLQHYDLYPGVLQGRAVIIRWEDTNGNGMVDLGDLITAVEHWAPYHISG